MAKVEPGKVEQYILHCQRPACVRGPEYWPGPRSRLYSTRQPAQPRPSTTAPTTAVKVSSSGSSAVLQVTAATRAELATCSAAPRHTPALGKAGPQSQLKLACPPTVIRHQPVDIIYYLPWPMCGCRYYLSSLYMGVDIIYQAFV